jgi:formate hydrogenlyase subunit 6/NADH:ubiquinone oxidoreductase subunit I
MPSTKTGVDTLTDRMVEAVDPGWLAQGVRSPKHLMLDPGNCILCGACEDVCPWGCMYVLAAGAPEDATGQPVEVDVGDGYAVFVIEDHVCTRCSACIDRCPTDTLYYARLSEDSGGTRTMAAVPTSQKAEAE